MNNKKGNNHPALKKLFLQAEYLIVDPEIYINPQGFNRKLDLFLADINASRWSFITAYNPGGNISATFDNIQQQSRLRNILQPWRILEGEGRSYDLNWREPSFLVLDINQEEAFEIAKKFGQAAILCGVIGEKARLIFV